jgi:hypothetical protein
MASTGLASPQLPPLNSEQARSLVTVDHLRKCQHILKKNCINLCQKWFIQGRKIKLSMSTGEYPTYCCILQCCFHRWSALTRTQRSTMSDFTGDLARCYRPLTSQRCGGKGNGKAPFGLSQLRKRREVLCCGLSIERRTGASAERMERQNSNLRSYC